MSLNISKDEDYVFSYNNSYSNNELSRNTKSFNNASKGGKFVEDQHREKKFREKDLSNDSINLTNNKENILNGNGVINLSETDRDRKIENFVMGGSKEIDESMIKNFLDESGRFGSGHMIGLSLGNGDCVSSEKQGLGRVARNSKRILRSPLKELCVNNSYGFDLSVDGDKEKLDTEEMSQGKSPSRFSMKDIQSFVNQSSALEEMPEIKKEVFEMNFKIDDETEEIEVFEQPKNESGPSDANNGFNYNDAELLGLKYLNVNRSGNPRAPNADDLKLNINPSLLAYHQQRDVHSKQTTNRSIPNHSKENSMAPSPSNLNLSKCSDPNNPLLKHLDLGKNSDLNFSDNDSGLMLRKLDSREMQIHATNADRIIASSKERQKLFLKE